jgi:mycobactin lysine-N-oxygenase
MDPASLAVIGAGPKAAALAARVAAIHVWRADNPEAATHVRPPPVLHIFERGSRAGVHWSGDAGYTDGDQELCTPPEADLVFAPYRAPQGEALDLAPFRWATFVAEHAILNVRPTHGQLADYVAWAIDRARSVGPGITLHTDSEVTALRRDGATWALATRPASNRPSKELPNRFDGVVVTSPGPALARFHVDPTIGHRVVDARTYWGPAARKDIAERILAGHRIAVIGGGGAAAAICVDALREIDDTTPDPGGVLFVAPQATLFTRGESQFETEIMTKAAAWSRLPRAARRQVAEHLTSGVVFRRVLDQLDGLAYAPEFLVARAIAAVPRGTAIALWCMTLDDEVLVVEVDRIVDASGFDALWFVDLLEEPTRSLLKRLGAAALADRVDPALRLVVTAPMFDEPAIIERLIDEHPALHVPFLAGGSRPPGRASLLQLGDVAAEILDPYLR